MVLECIRDDGYAPEMMVWIENFPVKGQYYYLRKRVHTSNGMGYLLDEIQNPVMPNGEEPNFHNSRFRAHDSMPELEESLTEQLEKVEG